MYLHVPLMNARLISHLFQASATASSGETRHGTLRLYIPALSLNNNSDGGSGSVQRGLNPLIRPISILVSSGNPLSAKRIWGLN